MYFGTFFMIQCTFGTENIKVKLVFNIAVPSWVLWDYGRIINKPRMIHCNWLQIFWIKCMCYICFSNQNVSIALISETLITPISKFLISINWISDFFKYSLHENCIYQAAEFKFWIILFCGHLQKISFS